MSHETASPLQTSGRAADASFDDAPVASQPQPCAPAGGSPAATRPATSWIEIMLIGEDDRPVVGERYRIELSDGSAIEGRIGPSGVVRVEGIEPGGYAVSFPRLDASAWEPVAAPARGEPP